MKTLEEIQNELLKSKDRLAKDYNIKSIGIFGSYAYGNPTEESDIDILVDFDKPIGLRFVSLADELEALLHQKVDLVSLNAINAKMKKEILEDIIYV